MTVTGTEAPAVTAGQQAELYEALAKFQAELPVITTNHTVRTEKYTYEYADLAFVSEIVLPLLGKHGLAFFSRPTLREDGKFVLAYKLVHRSGGTETGDYPLTGGLPAQQTGSAITYARRYALYAVTGVFPSGEDDDGQAAQNGWHHSRGEAPRGNAEQHQDRVSRPSPRQQAAAAKADLGDWGIRILDATTDDGLAAIKAELDEAHAGGKIPAARANEILSAIKDRRRQIDSKQGQPS